MRSFVQKAQMAKRRQRQKASCWLFAGLPSGGGDGCRWRADDNPKQSKAKQSKAKQTSYFLGESGARGGGNRPYHLDVRALALTSLFFFCI
jgi:hypothetical protein